MIFSIYQKKIFKNLFFIFLILILNFLLAPYSWEPSMESLKNWAAANIFSQTFGFPVISINPLYNLYLQFLLLFDAPLALQLEHLTTNTFACFTLLLFLNRFVNTRISFLILAIWIPWLWGIEAGSRVFALGFFNLYFAIKFGNIFNRGFLPSVLLISALCDNAYIIFLIFHIITYFSHVIYFKIKIQIKEFLNTNYLIENIVIVFFFYIINSNIFFSIRQNR